MTVHDHTPPPKAKKAKPRVKSTKASAPRKDAPTTEGPWRIEADGSKVRNSKVLPLENKLKELFAGISGVVTIGGDQFVGEAIAQKGPELAYGYARLAQENPQVKRALSWLLEGSAYTEALIPTVSLLIMVGWHYGFPVPDRLAAPLIFASGVAPRSREVEVEERARMRAQAQAEANAADTAEKENVDDDD